MKHLKKNQKIKFSKNKKSSTTSLRRDEKASAPETKLNSELKSPVTLSKNKLAFLASLREKKDASIIHWLSVGELEEVKKRYEKKYQIKIVVNGETEFGKKCKQKYSETLFLAEEKEITYYNLTHAEMLEEIDIIQKDIKDSKDLVSYIYTNGAYEENRRHFELVLIGKDFIINPIKYPYDSSDRNQYIKREDFAPSKIFYDTDFSLLRMHIEAIDSAEYIPPCPLGDTFSCGALALKYANNLSKENAKQLNELCLKIPFLNHKNQLLYFFFPSPQVLYYSQSSQYNEALFSLLTSDKESIKIKCNVFIDEKRLPDQELYFKPIKTLLKDSIHSANQIRNTSLFDSNRRILKDLKNFRERWIKEYHLMAAKRALMVVAEEDAKHNYALLRAARKYSQHPVSYMFVEYSKRYASSDKKEDRIASFRFRCLAADSGDLNSQIYVGITFRDLFLDNRTNKETLCSSVHYLQLAVEQKSARAMVVLGMVKLIDEKDLEAKNLFELAIKTGNSDGHLGLALYYTSKRNRKLEQAAYHSRLALEKVMPNKPDVIEKCRSIIAEWEAHKKSIEEKPQSKNSVPEKKESTSSVSTPTMG